MTTTTDNPRHIFDRLVRNDPPAGGTSALIDTACVLGGSIAGLFAARALADHARSVVVIERDEVTMEGRPRAGTPHDRQLHALLPAGRSFLDRWLPGFTREVLDRGGVLIRSDQLAIFVGGRQQVESRGSSMLGGTRPFLESLIRSRVLATPNVRTISAVATGIEVHDNAVRAIRYVQHGKERSLAVDFAVDAMGRSSRLAAWVEGAGYQRPPLERLPAAINYATALFERTTESSEMPIVSAHARPVATLRPETPHAYAFPVESDQWMVLLMEYGDDRPPTTIEAFRAACTALPDVFGRAVAGKVTRGIETYRQADSRRRDFTGLARYPSRLISVGDSVASFNPIYGQGMSSAALQASALSEYLTSRPSLDRAATEYFTLQSVVVDAAWTMSAGVDAARLDAINRVDVADDVKQRRWALDQVMKAAQVDPVLTEASSAVTAMLAHPSTLAEPALLERAVAVNRQGCDESTLA
ncbi:FAD-dependent monooxygenase [Mycobacterium sp. 21AC1]|uniref:NAD(P)/FAD-dependent oxidoreductase n=1 Tax=[Mycobacterium] appelbergii TaxID=2939269 RepID=UPI00293904B9|nr:FAD-dependent monooxygenase [Mycobacterium sp. 21AC1]MDV3128364.1 FAD-dependent monooxygenase [Mycobacterium sp. 21AC1]